MNTLKTSKEKVQKEKHSKSFTKLLANFFSGDFLSKENVVSSLPYIFFLTFLGILYIANGYQAEKIIRRLNKVSDNLKELRSEYITIKSDLNFQSKQSQIAQTTEKMGIKESTIPPTKIVVNQEDMQKIIPVD